ncbi:MAG TPA: metallophosphoesterase [Blastocatellia bacterium]|nr:metallophosphoesterase [Blastocatellia bacterium]
MIRKIYLLMICLLCAFLVIATARGARTLTEPDNIRFAVIGDTGTGESNQFEVAQSMIKVYQQEPFGFVLMLGDNIYGSINSRAFQERFEQPYRNLITHGVKFRAVLGNHDKGGSEKETGYERFNMIGRRFYTFTSGSGTKGEPLAQFFGLDSSRMDEDQLAWLEKELAASNAIWKIPFFHHPIYSSGRKHGSDMKLRRALEPLFTRYGVRVALSGHDHIYERIKPQEGIIYFVSGSGGQLRKGDIKRNDPIFAAGNDQVCHFMLFDIKEDEARFRAIDINGAVIDQGVISAKPEVNGQ